MKPKRGDAIVFHSQTVGRRLRCQQANHRCWPRGWEQPAKSEEEMGRHNAAGGGGLMPWAAVRLPTLCPTRCPGRNLGRDGPGLAGKRHHPAAPRALQVDGKAVDPHSLHTACPVIKGVKYVGEQKTGS